MPDIFDQVASNTPTRDIFDTLAEAPAPKPKPATPELPTQFEYSLNLDEQGVPLPLVSREGLAKQYTAPVEKVKPVVPQGPGLKDVEIGARQGAVGLVQLYGNLTDKTSGARLASGRGIGEAAEEYLGPKPEDVEARQSTASKIIQGAARAPLDIAPYLVTPGGPVASMAGVDALRAAGQPDADIGDIAAGGAKGAAMGAALGPLGRYSRKARVPAAAALGGGATALEGGNASDVVASGVVMGGLSGMHGARPKPPELAEPRQQTPLEWAKAQDYEARLDRPPLMATPGAPLGSAPKMPLDRLMEREGVPVEREGVADAEWWKQQPETQYADLFDQAEKLEKRRARTKPEIPETGIPEGVARGVDARQRIAQQVAGKPWEELTPAERLVVDDLIAEGNVGAGGAPEIPTPPPLETPGKPPVRPAEPRPAPPPEVREPASIAPKPEPKPYALTPEEQAALREKPPVAPAEPVRAEADAPTATVDNAATVEPIQEPRVPTGGEQAIQRDAGERGSFSLKPTGPQTPSEVYAKEMIAKREAARKGPMRDMLDRLKGALAKAKAEGVDSTAPILDTIHKAQKEHGFELLPSENIEHQIDRALRHRSIADKFMQDNKLLDAIRQVDDIDYFDQYLIAKQALDVEAHGFKTGRDLARDGQLVRDFGKRYVEAEKAIREYDRKLMEYSVDAGLVSPELSAYLQQIYKDYVPLNRVFNALEKTDLGQVGRGKGVASLSKQTVVQKLMGSEREIENPLASFIDKTYRAFSQGERNKAGRMLAGYRELPGMEGLITEAAPGAHVPAERSFYFLDGGAKRTFETTREIAAAAKSLDVRDIGLLGQIFAVPARIMKTGTTGINLPFVASNVAVDQTFTLITSRYDRSLANPITFVRALTAALKHNELWDEMVREGGGFTSFDISRNAPKQTIDRIRAGRGGDARARYVIEHPVATVAELFRTAEDIVSKSEQFGRLRLYESAKQAALKAGRTEADARIVATQHANNALPNYMRAGSIMRPVNASVPYLNAGVQGSRAFLRAMQENPGRTSASVVTTLFFPVAMATMWNLSDPDRKRAYADIQDYEKENNIIILGPGRPAQDKQGRYEVIKIKLPPGLNKLASPVRRFLEQAEGLDPVKFREMVEAAIGVVSPVEPNMSGLSNVVPQLFKPTVQAAANYDLFRGRPKVPGRLQDEPPALQVQPYTSGTARKIGGALGVSPIKTEEFIKDTLGGIGSQVLNVSDRALAASGAIPKEHIGGTSTAEAVAARFGAARGGELDNREYAKRKQIEDAAITRAVERAKQTPFYGRLDSEDKRQKYLETVSNRARYEVTKVTSTPRYKRMQPEQRMEELKRVEARIGRAGVRPSVTRPTPPTLRSPRPFEARQ